MDVADKLRAERAKVAKAVEKIRERSSFDDSDAPNSFRAGLDAARRILEHHIQPATAQEQPEKVVVIDAPVPAPRYTVGIPEGPPNPNAKPKQPVPAQEEKCQECGGRGSVDSDHFGPATCHVCKGSGVKATPKAAEEKPIAWVPKVGDRVRVKPGGSGDVYWQERVSTIGEVLDDEQVTLRDAIGLAGWWAFDELERAVEPAPTETAVTPPAAKAVEPKAVDAPDEKTHDNGGVADECLGCGAPWSAEAGHMACPRPCLPSGWPQPLTNDELERLKSKRRAFLEADAAWPVGETGDLAEARGRALAAYQIELECCAWVLIAAAEELAQQVKTSEREEVKAPAPPSPEAKPLTLTQAVAESERERERLLNEAERLLRLGFFRDAALAVVQVLRADGKAGR